MDFAKGWSLQGKGLLLIRLLRLVFFVLCSATLCFTWKVLKKLQFVWQMCASVVFKQDVGQYWLCWMRWHASTLNIADFIQKFYIFMRKPENIYVFVCVWCLFFTNIYNSVFFCNLFWAQYLITCVFSYVNFVNLKSWQHKNKNIYKVASHQSWKIMETRVQCFHQTCPSP